MLRVMAARCSSMQLTHGRAQFRELHPEMVQLSGREENKVEDLDHQRHKEKVLSSVQYLSHCAVHRVGIHIYAQLPACTMRPYKV